MITEAQIQHLEAHQDKFDEFYLQVSPDIDPGSRRVRDYLTEYGLSNDEVYYNLCDDLNLTPIGAERAVPHGGDMTAGVGQTARAHLETPDEIAATPTDIEVGVFAAGGGEPVLELEGESFVISGDPEGGVTLSNRDQWPHAKVVLLMVSVGGDDAARSYEQFVADIKHAVIEGGAAKAATETGGYYIVSGKVCLPGDYDPATRDFRDGATPPTWAGGPPGSATKKSSEAPNPEERISLRHAHQTGELPRRAVKVAPTEVPEGASAEEAVRALAEGMNREVTGE